MHKPLHPGEFITEVYLSFHSVSQRELARHLDVSLSRLNRLLHGLGTVNADMALRLEKTLGRSAESWLAMQRNHGLWRARRRVNLSRVSKLELRAA